MAGNELCTTSQWIKFFCNAGLPTNVATNYAIIFADNRIQQNMLMDLSKEYLYDMGIKVMGDVIAILKYAKEFHNQIVTQKIIGSNEKQSSPVVRSSPATRMLRHYTRPASSPKKLSEENTFQRAIPSPVRKRISMPVVEEVPVKKIRRVLPEEEGGYTIKMPAGTTERSRKIIEQQQQQVTIGSKKSVFDRLGDSHVSSSTDVKRNVAASRSVFKRLGPTSGEVSTSTTIKTKVSTPAYRGVLKTAAPEKKLITTVKRPQVARITSLSRTVPVSARLGAKSTTVSRRTVIGNNTGVNQINSILQKNASLFAAGRTVAGTRKTPIPTRQLVVSRLGQNTGTVVRAQTLKQGPLVLKRTINTQVVPGKGSVFKRLG